jgi:hypothetical protein
MNRLMKCWIACNVFVFIFLTDVFAQSNPEETMDVFSTRMIELAKGPVAKLLGAAILLVGIASLLRGRHKIAMSCAVAFLVLLFLPFFLQQI